MSENKVIATVKDYERNKIYRLHRRLDGLNELLETLDNTKIQIKNLENMKERIKSDIISCQNKKQKWWNIIGIKYKLPKNKRVSISFSSGDIRKA